jgi:hypothetical protein
MRVELCLASAEPVVAFGTLAAVIAVGTGASAALWPLMKTIADRTAELKTAMPDTLADRFLVRKRRRKLGIGLIGWALIVNLFNVGALAVFWLILIFGPQVVLKSVASGTVLQNLSTLERILYFVTAIAWALAYLYQGVMPWWQGLRQYVRATLWLRDRAKGT